MRDTSIKTLAKRYIRRYFHKSIDAQIQMFNLIAIMGIAALTCRGLIALIFHELPFIYLGDFITAAIMIASFAVADYFKKPGVYRVCSWIMIAVVFMIFFPMLFFRTGGHQGGMLCYFVLAITFTAFLFKKNVDLTVALLMEFFIYVSCLLVNYFMPDFVDLYDERVNYFADAIIGFCMSCVMILSVAHIRIKVYHERQMEVQKLTEELEARNSTLARYDRMKSDFLATVAHEINTPLAVIAACSSDALDLLGDEPLAKDEIIEDQQTIITRVKTIDSILLDLMDITAIENGRLSLNPEPVSLEALICETCIDEPLTSGGCRIKLDLAEDLPELWVDKQRIKQVLTNLVSNASRYAKASVIAVSLKPAQNGQIVSVADDGDGIDPKVVEQIFKQYISTKPEQWRHGIGLYVCKQIMLAHGGDIWIESGKGKGTTVSFLLKASSPAESYPQ